MSRTYGTNSTEAEQKGFLDWNSNVISFRAGRSTRVTGSDINNQVTDRPTHHIVGVRDAGMVRGRPWGPTFRYGTRIGSPGELQVSRRCCQGAESTYSYLGAAQLRLSKTAREKHNQL